MPRTASAPPPRRARVLPVIGMGVALGCAPATPQVPAVAPAIAPADESPPTAVAGEVRAYPLVGVVRTVDRESGSVAIRHEAIPGFMPAMTMPFDLKADPILAELQVGDTISGTLRVEVDRSSLTDVVITALAEPTPADGPAVPRATIQPGDPVPDLTVTTQDGTPLRLADLRGRTIVLTFIYTRCPLPDFCPAIDRKFAELARRLATADGGDGVRLLSVSFDPEHDTPAVLAAHARLLGAKPPRWTFAVASHEALFPIAAALGLNYAPTGREIIHSLSTAVIGPDGRLVGLWTGSRWPTAEVARAALDTQSRKDVPG